MLRVGFACEFDIYQVPLHEPIWQRLVEVVEAFWLSVERDTPPLPDYSRDGKLLQALTGASDGSTVDLSGDNELIHALHEFERTKQLLGVIQADADRLSTLIRHKVGAAESAQAGDFRISLKSHPRAGYTVKPSIQRPLKLKRIRETQN